MITSMIRIHIVMMMRHFQNSKLELKLTGPTGQRGQLVTSSALQMEIRDRKHENASVSMMMVHQPRLARATVITVLILNFVHVSQHHHHVQNGPSGDTGHVAVVPVVVELVKDNDHVCMVAIVMVKKNKFNSGKYSTWNIPYTLFSIYLIEQF